ncbi:hypothetical protein NQ318_014813 [Aromia moschata]|uniref:ELM2 domain-containing protein n=1 Tax=Aromia moschata TaxID=1265417 RepID=A0AAV8ZEE5_9CUCU|nr:hypothetical protein NQ318_014813 [Aromia moschata]
MEEFIISCDKNENDDSTNDDKSDSSVDTLANDFDEEIRLEEEDSTSVNEEEDDIYSYNPDDDHNRMIIKTIMVGNDFQAQVPDGLCHYDDALPYENEDKLIWDPNVIDNLAVEDYLKKAAAVSRPLIPMGIHLRDNEQALYLLQQCGHNVEEALRRLRMNVTLYNENMSPWSEEECRNFEAGVRIFGKNFYLTQQNKVRTRLEKKKYTLHPGVTDFMDRFLEDHDVRDRSSSPNTQCGIADERKLLQNQTIKFKINK